MEKTVLPVIKHWWVANKCSVAKNVNLATKKVYIIKLAI